MIDILFNGVGWTDIALTLNRIAVGAFFMLSGCHKLFNGSAIVLRRQLKGLGVHAVGFNQWWVPTVEFTAGGAVLVGFLAPLAAFGLLVLIFVTIATSGRQRIKLYKPIDEADRVDDWLYLPETLYAVMLIVVISAGAGPYSLDAVILGLIENAARDFSKIRPMLPIPDPAAAKKGGSITKAKLETWRQNAEFHDVNWEI